MIDVDPRLFSWGTGALLVGLGGYAIWRMIGGFQSAKQVADNRPLKEAVAKGDFIKAARLASEAGDWEEAARYFLRLGKELEAARALRKAESWSRAAELFDSNHDYRAAAQCYGRAGNTSAQMRMLEAAQDWATAAQLYEQKGDLRQAAESWQRADQPLKAAELLERIHELPTAQRLRAQHDEKSGNFAQAARHWLQLNDASRALDCLERAGDADGVTELLLQTGAHERAAERLASSGRFAEAGQAYERVPMYRKAALCFQKAGETERAIQCLTLDGDRLAVIKMRAALGQADEALRVALAIPTTDAIFVEVGQIAVELLVNRGDKAQALRILLQLLSAPLPAQERTALGKQGAELALELNDAAGGRQLLDRLAPMHRPGASEEPWLAQLRARTDELRQGTETADAIATPHPPSEPEVVVRSEAQKRASDGESTETVDEMTRTPPSKISGTQSFPGGSAGPEQRDAHGLAVPGWPSGIPQSLSSRYGELERLGQGGNGVVFRARDIMLGRQVVLKFMIQGTMPSEMARKYFLREVKLSANLNHPNIVHIYDMGNTDDMLWYAMEYVEGSPLTAYLNHGQPVRDHVFLVSVLEQLANALDYAHKQGLVHRDIKPDNILIATDGTLKLLDFGLARVLDDGFGEQSVLAGTPFYMAPEQLDGSDVNHRADLYAVGVVLFRMLTGYLPYTEGNVFVAHATAPVPSPLVYNPTLPAKAAEIIAKALAKRPAERYANCRQMAMDVHEALFGHVRPAR